MDRLVIVRRALVAAAGVALIVGVAGVRAGGAQEQSILVEGRVQWISGQQMVVAPVGAVVAPAGTSAINVDLTQVSQDQYSGLTTGTPVAVRGTVSSARDRIIATSIQRLTPP
jgi:hypothetical protein